MLHTHSGVADRFISDVQELTAELVKNPPKDKGESVSYIYLFMT